MDKLLGRKEKNEAAHTTHTLILAAQAKAFPFAGLAAAMLINSLGDEKKQPIHITTEPIASFDPAEQNSTVKLLRREDRAQFVGCIVATKQLASDFPKANLRADIAEDERENEIFITLSQCYSQDQNTVKTGLTYFNKELGISMHVNGVHQTVGDLLLWGAIRGNSVSLSDVMAGKYPNIESWYKEIMEKLPYIHQAEAFLKEKETAPKAKPKNIGFKLDGAEMGKVVTRFPPEPSGYLHIGHAKAAILNASAARDYDGKFIVRFDDTNPSKERAEFQDSQLEDLKTLGIYPDEVTFTSNYFDQIEQRCRELILAGKAYCDDTSVEEMRKQRMDGIASKCRERLPQDSIRIFDEMKKFSDEGRRHCVRAKISIDNKNKALRDPVIYRCNDTPHHRTGTKYKMYPTYDFACPIVDSMEGVTHALRTLEYKDRDAQYAWMLKALAMRPVKVIGFSRLNFVRTVLSKRKLQWFVDKGLVSGWDDPRFPTVRGVMRRGCVIEALRKFIISQGPSRNINNLEWASFWAENKKNDLTNGVRVHLIDGDGIPQKPETRQIACHKKNPALGKKPVWYAETVLIEQDDAQQMKEGEEITLMDWGNAIVRKIKSKEVPESKDPIITSIDATLHLIGDFKKTEKKIHWVADVEESLTPCTLTTFDHLITKDKLEEGDDVAEFVNPDTVSYVEAIGDVNLRDMPVGEIIQFERKGYYRLDRAFDKATGKAGEFFLIPDGKTVNKYGTKKD